MNYSNNNMNEFYIKQFEKKDIIKRSNAIGFSLLIKYALSLGISFLLAFIFYTVIGLSAKETAALSENLVVMSSLNAIASVLIFFFIFYFCCKLLKLDIYSTCGFKAPKICNETLLCFGFCFFAIFCGGFLTNIVSILSETFINRTPVEPTFTDFDSNIFTFLVTLMTSCFVPALVEEFAFRGVVLGSLRKFGDWPAIIVSTLLFSAMHENFVQIPYTFCLGLALAISRVVTNSIWPGIIVHFLNNALACFSDVFSSDIVSLISSVSFFIYFILGGICLIILLSKSTFKTRIHDVPSSLSKLSRIGYMIVAPATLISLLIMLIKALFSFKVV